MKRKSLESKKIGKAAFFKNQLTSLTIGSTLDLIPENAFAYNTITNVTIPGNVEQIEQFAFSNNNIKTISLSEGLQEIETQAFSTNNLNFVDLPASITNLAIDAFDPNTTLDQSSEHPHFHVTNGEITSYTGDAVDLIIPPAINGQTILSIDEYVFSGANLRSVKFPNTLKTIKSNAFAFNQLTALVLPSGITHIEENSFDNNQLEVVTLNEGLKKLGKGAFTNNPMPEIFIPESLKQGNASAFDEKILIYGKHIDKAGFKCSNATLHGYYGRLTEIIIPEKINGKIVKVIGDYAFAGLPITSITIPASLKRIRQTTFSDPPPKIIRE